MLRCCRCDYVFTDTKQYASRFVGAWCRRLSPGFQKYVPSWIIQSQIEFCDWWPEQLWQFLLFNLSNKTGLIKMKCERYKKTSGVFFYSRNWGHWIRSEVVSIANSTEKETFAMVVVQVSCDKNLFPNLLFELLHNCEHQ